MTRFQPDSAEAWAVLYLHDWDPPKEGQEHRWEPGKNVFPEIHNIYLTLQEADAVRRRMSDPNKYWVCRVHIPAPAVGPGEPADYVLVPREPTREMWAAMADAVVGKTAVHHDVVIEAVYRAMVGAALPSEAIGRDQVIAQCAIIALEQRCERGTPWDLACTTIAEKIRALLVSRPHHQAPMPWVDAEEGDMS